METKPQSRVLDNGFSPQEAHTNNQNAIEILIETKFHKSIKKLYNFKKTLECLGFKELIEQSNGLKSLTKPNYNLRRQTPDKNTS